MNSLTLNDTLTLLENNALQNADYSSSLALGSNLNSNVSLTYAAKVLSGSPVEIIYKSSISEIFKNFVSIDLDNMNEQKKAVLNQVVRCDLVCLIPFKMCLPAILDTLS